MNTAEIEGFAEMMQSVGFERTTKVLFTRGKLSVKLENALLPKNVSPADFPPFLTVKVYDPKANTYLQMTCPFDTVQWFANIQT